jgi:hypothetical protein
MTVSPRAEGFFRSMEQNYFGEEQKYLGEFATDLRKFLEQAKGQSK